MKKLIIPASAALAVNLLAGLLLTAYAPMTLLFTSMVIVINTLLTGLLYALGAESTHRMSLGMAFSGVWARWNLSADSSLPSGGRITGGSWCSSH